MVLMLAAVYYVMLVIVTALDNGEHAGRTLRQIKAGY